MSNHAMETIAFGTALQDVGQSTAASTAASTSKDAAQNVAEQTAAKRSAKLKALKAKREAEETPAKLTHADSLAIFGTDGDFVSQCNPTIEIGTCLDRHSILKNKSGAANDSILAGYNGIGQASAETVALPSPTPRGSNALDSYTSTAVGAFGIMVLLLIVVRAMGDSFVSAMASMTYKGMGWKKIEASTSGQTGLNLLLLNLVYAIGLSTVIVETSILIAPDFCASYGNVTLTALTAGCVALGYIVRYIADDVIAFAFDVREHMRHTKLYKQTTCALIGLALMPMALLMPFMSDASCLTLIKAVIVLGIALSVLRIVWTVKINSYNLSSVFYILLYLCVVEALPIVCAAKVATRVANITI